MAQHTGTEESTKYNQAVINTASGTEDSTRSSSQSSAQESEARSSGTTDSTRNRETADKDSSSARSEGTNKQTGLNRSESARTAETSRALTATSTQVTRVNDKSNIGFQVAFIVPIRSITPHQPA